MTILKYYVGLIFFLGLLSNSTRIAAQTTGPKQNLPAGITATGSFCSPSANTACGGGAVTFADSRTDAVGWNWQFASMPTLPGSGSVTNPGSGSSTATTRTVTKTFTVAGVQDITLIRTLQGGGTETVPFSVTIGQTPQSFNNKWRPDTTICKGEVLDLNPYTSSPPGYTYKWAPKGQTTQALSITESGCYSVEVKNDGCPYEDLIHVDVCFEPPGSPAAKWHFGNNAGLDFAGGAPQPLTDSKLDTKEGASSMSDSKGNLLFYTDGVHVYDKDGNPMPTIPASASSTPLGGSQFSTQSALIVPKPTCRGCEYLFYVYTTAEINGTKQLTYSIVDMRENDGKGAIVGQNLPVATDPTILSTERSAAVENEADSTYWVITHDFGGNVFRITHLTRSGTPTQTTVAAGMPQSTSAQAEGYMKIGPAPTSSSANSGTVGSGTATSGSSNTAVRPLAVVVPGPPNNYVELYDFDMDSGKLTYKRTIDLGAAPPKAYGVEFSPDGKKLYVTLLGDPVSGTGNGASSYILQYDLTQTDPDSFSNSRTEIATSTTQQFGALQMGSDGRIYVAIPGQTSLGVIENPNASLLDSLRFNPVGQDLGGKKSQLGLPNQVANFNQPPSSSPGLDHDGECAGESTTFTIGAFCQKLKETYTLNFGDGTTPKSFTQAQTQEHVYKTPGSYTATLTIVTRKNAPQGQTGDICSVTTVTDSFTIVEKPKSFSLGPDQLICQTSVDLTIPVEASNYAWINNGRIVSRSKTYTVTRTGLYRGFAFNNPDCYEDSQVNIILAQPPSPRLTPSSTICAGTSTTLGVGTPRYETFKWSNGETQRTITVSKAGVYSVTATYPNPTGSGECTAIESTTLNITPKPKLVAAPKGPTGCTTTDGSITLTPTPAGSYTYTWSRADGSLLPSVTNQLTNVGEGAYKVSVAAQCTVDSSFALKSPANPLSASTLSTSALCSIPNSGSVALNNVQGSPTGYTWRDASGAIVSSSAAFTGAAAGTYVLEISDAGGCRLSIPNIPVGLDPRGFASLPTVGGCIGDVLSLTPSGANIPGNTYQWSTGATTPTISVSAPGSFSVTIRNTINGCVGSGSTNVTFSPKPTVSAGPALSLCVGLQPVQLTGSSPSGGSWGGSPNVSPTGSFTPIAALVGANITVTYSVTQNGCANAATRNLSVNPPPQVNAGPDVEYCANAVQSIQATGSAGAAFRWSDGTTGPILRPGISGTFVVTATLNGCDATDDVGVRIKSIPQFSFTKDAAICIDDDQSTSLVVRGGTGLTYSWPDLGSSATAVTVNRSGSYSLVVTNTENCVVREIANVQDLCEPRVFIPEAFTPNGDIVNDQLEVFTAYTIDFELRIYNRWGEVIFASNSPEQKWDGTYKGVAYPPMIYAYTVTYRSRDFPNRPPITKRGSVTIIR